PLHGARGGRRLGRRPGSGGSRGLRGRARRRLAGARLRAALARRPLRDLHGRHDGHAPGRTVAAGGTLLSRHGEPPSRGGPPPERAEEGGERAAAKPAQAGMSAAPLIHGAGQLGSWIAMLQGWKICLAPRFDPHLVWSTIERERPISLSIVGDAMARPLAE